MFTYINEEKDIKNTICIEIKHFMEDRAIYSTEVNVKATIPQIIDQFWNSNSKLKSFYGTKGLYSTVVR